MNLTNFRLETDSDGIALLTWDMPSRSMNVITPEVISELEMVIDHVAAEASIKGCVITSGKETFSGGADLSMLQTAADDYLKAKQDKGEEAATKLFFESCEPPFADLSQARNMRQTFRNCDQWHVSWRRLRTCACLPLPGHRR